MRYVRNYIGLVAVVVGLLGYCEAAAESFSSSNYRVNGVVGNSFSSSTSSATYQLESSGGESIIGNGASGSYKLGEGYIAQLSRSLTLSSTSGAINFGTVYAGTSSTQNNTITVATDYSSYALSIHQDKNLTKGSDTIPAVSGTIASPVSWSEGTTKGLGFTLASASAAGTLLAKWNSGASFAAIPTAPTDTVFYNRDSISAYTTDTVGFRYRLDVAGTQPSGIYTNTVTITCAAVL
jgi:hypothetical protein